MRRVLVVLWMVVGGMAFAATDMADMAETARTIVTVETACAGTALVTCDEPNGWSFDVKSASDDGRDVVTVTIASEKESRPPRFGILFRVSGAGVQNVWTCDTELDGCHLRPQLWWGWCAKYSSQLARDMPIAVGFNADERAPVALACSEAFEFVNFGLYADDRTCELIGRCEFFRQPVAPRKAYTVSVMLDRRNRGFADTVRACSDWIVARNGFVPAAVPEVAREPVYSTWYAYLQDVHAGPLEKEAKLAASIGMKTMILDDGWQKAESRNFYSATGDWMPVPSRFPDMKAHVGKVHAAGLKYMLWLGVPLVGDESKAFARFRDKLLKYENGEGTLDPRFPEVREYLIETYARVVGEWGFDGVKLDFIDQLQLPKNDPAVAENYRGRDCKSLPEAIDRLMKDVKDRLSAIKPDVLIEFRQHYIGPAMRQYGNILRAWDCPADPCANRRRICDLRLTSGNTAVHSDMLVWSKDETSEGAALPILNALFSTIQYSMVLAETAPGHAEVIRHWIGFSAKHREALQKGAFTPHHAENGYTWIEGSSGSERIIATYSAANMIPLGKLDRRVVLVNATRTNGVVVDLNDSGRARFFDVVGRVCGSQQLLPGLSRLNVPPSGYAEIDVKTNE